MDDKFTPFADLIAANSNEFKLDSNIIKATIMTESLGNPWSYRYEPTYSYLLTPRTYAEQLIISVESETVLQQTSLGLMHVMGAVAREYGWQKHLSQLFDPKVSLWYGCKHLFVKATKYGSDPCTIYAAYNAGAPRKTPGGMFVNQVNVDRFYQNLLRIEKGDIT